MGRIVEIGSLREPVEVLDEPQPAPEERIGRIKHQNGENVAMIAVHHLTFYRACEWFTPY